MRLGDVPPSELLALRKAMSSEWAKWTQLDADRRLGLGDLQSLRNVPGASYVNTLWAITLKDTSAWKARPVVVGFQEPQN